MSEPIEDWKYKTHQTVYNVAATIAQYIHIDQPNIATIVKMITAYAKSGRYPHYEDENDVLWFSADTSSAIVADLTNPLPKSFLIPAPPVVDHVFDKGLTYQERHPGIPRQAFINLELDPDAPVEVKDYFTSNETTVRHSDEPSKPIPIPKPSWGNQYQKRKK